MKKPAVTPVPVEKTLAEQKSDFTVEGSPPPGKVSTAIPARSPEADAPNPPRGPVQGTVPGTVKPKRSPEATNP